MTLQHQRKTKIYASILSANFGHLHADLHKAEEAGVDGFHIDIMDGHFVPDISFGASILPVVQRVSSLPCDVHLMVMEPERHLERIIQYQPSAISLHPESTLHIHRALSRIKMSGIRSGVVLNPGTPIEAISSLWHMLDFILVMTVDPGFAGQVFQSHLLKKIQQLYVLGQQYGVEIAVDGGVNANTAPHILNAGADVLISGSFIFSSQDYRTSIMKLRDGACLKI